MLSLVNILICFFIFLIMYQIFLATKIIEGIENNQYQDYDPNDPLILAEKNAGNIMYLKERLDSFEDINKQVQDLSGNVVTLQDQVNSLLQSQQDYANQMTGGTAPEISGTVDNGDDDEAVNQNQS